MDSKELLRRAAEALLTGNGEELTNVVNEAQDTVAKLEELADNYRVVVERVTIARDGMKALAESLLADQPRGAEMVSAEQMEMDFVPQEPVVEVEEVVVEEVPLVEVLRDCEVVPAPAETEVVEPVEDLTNLLSQQPSDASTVNIEDLLK